MKRERERETRTNFVSHFLDLIAFQLADLKKRIFSLSLSRWTGTTHQLRDAQRRSTQLESDEACGKKNGRCIIGVSNPIHCGGSTMATTCLPQAANENEYRAEKRETIFNTQCRIE